MVEMSPTTGMASLTLLLTVRECQDLFDLLAFEQVDTADPRAIVDWLLYQVGVLPEGDIPANLPEGSTDGGAP